MRTTAPRHFVILYDGHCRFCDAGSRRLASWMKSGCVERADFHEPAVLSRFPGLTHDQCMKQMHLVTPDGRVFGGAESVARAVATRPLLGKLAWLFFVPGIRQLLEAIYKWVALNRYRLMGRKIAAGECHEGTCSLH